MKPTDKEIEEARRFLVSEKNFILPLPESIAKYALIKSKEAYEAGVKYGKEYGDDISYLKRRNSTKDPIIKAYDQWKEQNQEQ